MVKPKKKKSPSVFEMNAQDVSKLDHDTLVGMVLRLSEQTRQLSELLQIMVREKHAPKTERFENPEQLNLFGDAASADVPAEKSAEAHTAPAPAPETPAAKTNKKPGHSRNPMPSHLERVALFCSSLTASDLACKCCDKPMTKVRDVLRNSRYEYKPASVFVQDLFATIYNCTECGTSQTFEPNVSQPIQNGNAGPALIAEVVTAKFVDHLPLHRQEQRFWRDGIPINRSTMVGWLTSASLTLRPIFERMHQLLLKAKIIATDDTPVKVQDRKKKGNIKISHAWIYRGCDEQPFNVFDFTTGRGRAGPMEFLKGFNMYLQGDCFSGNLALCAEAGATHVACGAHARRYFVQALPNNQKLCAESLVIFSDLFEIERSAKELGLSCEETKLMREQESVPLLAKLKSWLDTQALTALPKSSFGKAVHYSLNNWKHLNNYLLDGDLRLDNNLAEHEMKRVAIGKKNWYFFGSDDAGKHSAVLLSITSTCHRHGVNASAYIKDVLEILSANPNTDIDALLPHNWKQARQLQNTEFDACHTTPKLSA